MVDYSREELLLMASAVKAKASHWLNVSSSGTNAGDPIAGEAHAKYSALHDKLVRAHQRACREESAASPRT
jgi:hypothetical protein